MSQDEFVTRKQLAITCMSSAAIAVLLGWAMARPDVWSLQASIEKLAAAVREVKAHQQNQSVTIGYDRNQTIRDILDRRVAANVHTATVRGTEPATGGVPTGVPSDRVGDRSASDGTGDHSERN